MFSVSAWVFPGVSILYVEKTKEVEVCWGVPYPPANRAGEVQKEKEAGGWNLCFIVVVLVIVWGIIFGDMYERGSFFIVSVLLYEDFLI